MIVQQAGDVLIVGAGPVGLLTAFALAQAGVSVTVVEAGAKINDSPRANTYFPSTMIALQELGILADAEARGCRATALSVQVPEYGFKVRIATDCLEGLTFPYYLQLGQDQLGEIAMAHAERLGVKIVFNTQLTSLDHDADGVRATVRNAGSETILAAKWLIGADGARSTVRKAIGAEFEGTTWPNRFVATNVICDMESLGFDDSNFVCDPVYMCVIARIDRKGLWRVTYQEDASYPIETYMDRLPERYAHILGKDVAYDMQSANPYTLHQRCATTLRQGRVLLAGDAAHATNPCGGLGLTTGIWDGLVLADVLSAVLLGKEDAAILDRYSQERRRVFWEISSPSATQNKLMLEQSDPEKRKADMAGALIAAEDPAIARLMMSFPFRVIGDTLHAESRWAHIDPTCEATFDITQRKSQFG